MMLESGECVASGKRAVLEPFCKWDVNMAKRTIAKHHHEESSESENETEPAKIFHRRLSTNAKSSVSDRNLFALFYVPCYYPEM